MMLIDKLAYSSKLRDKSPFVKMFFAVGTLLICVASRSFIISILTLVIMGCMTVTYSRISYFYYLKLMCAPVTFLILGTIAIAVNYTEMPMDLFSIAVGSHYLAVSKASSLYAMRLIVVSLASVSSLYFLALTTTMLDIISVLRYFRCPWIIVELMMLMYRYIFVLLDMASTMLIAQKCRLGNASLKASINEIGNMLSVLLIKALDKSRALFDAMESRSYNGKINVLNETIPAKLKEKIALGCFLTFMTIIGVVCNIKGGF